MKAIARTDPTPVIVHNSIQGSGATGTYYNLVTAVVQMAASAGSLFAWINPETGTVLAKVMYYFTTAGTGTVDVGKTDDGTATVADVIDGGTMAVGIVYRPGTNATLGQVDEGWILVGPGGTGTNNSVTLTSNEAATSTGVGGLVVQYAPIGR